MNNNLLKLSVFSDGGVKSLSPELINFLIRFKYLSCICFYMDNGVTVENWNS